MWYVSQRTCRPGVFFRQAAFRLKRRQVRRCGPERQYPWPPRSADRVDVTIEDEGDFEGHAFPRAVVANDTDFYTQSVISKREEEL
jgi:hypothetical protein